MQLRCVLQQRCCLRRAHPSCQELCVIECHMQLCLLHGTGRQRTAQRLVGETRHAFVGFGQPSLHRIWQLLRQLQGVEHTDDASVTQSSVGIG
eukprot:4205795-Prymnesium_polylepis.1